MQKKTIIGYTTLLIFLLAVVVGGLWYLQEKEEPQRVAHIALAKCLQKQGAVFYGAFWCPACARQKALFSKTAGKSLPYAECSTPDRTDQTQICKDKGVKSYPTWEFADGTRACGVMPPEILARLSGCAVPPSPSEEEHTVQGLYEQLVEKSIRKTLAAQSKTPEEIKEQLDKAKGIISALMKLRGGEPLDTSTDIDALLFAVFEASYRCPTPSVEKVDEEEEEIEIVPGEAQIVPAAEDGSAGTVNDAETTETEKTE